MTGSIFDWVLAAVLATISVILLLGKGEFILKAINGGRRKETRWGDKEKKRYSRAMGVFVGVLAIDEVIIALYSDNQWMMLACLLIAVGALVGMGKFSRNYSRK